MCRCHFHPNQNICRPKQIPWVPRIFLSSICILESSDNHPPITLTAPCLLYTLKKPHNVETVALFWHYFANWACGSLHGAQVRHRRTFWKISGRLIFFYQFPRGCGNRKLLNDRQKTTPYPSKIKRIGVPITCSSAITIRPKSISR